jgi:Tol biopolymer transport system component
MNRFAGPLLLCAVVDLPLVSIPADVLTIAQNDVHRRDLDRAPVDVTADGRYIAFTSYSRLVPADANDTRDVYVLDRATGSVTLESVAFDGIAGTDSGNPGLSDDGRFLVYETHLRSGNAEPLNIVLRDRREATVRILSRGVAGEPANGPSRTPAISGDGRLVAFTSAATNLTAGNDASGASEDIYTADMSSGTVRRITAPPGNVSASPGFSSSPAVSATGRYVAFVSSVRSDSDVYIHDANLGTTTRVSVGRGGTLPNARSAAPTISADGKHVAFISAASNLVVDDDNQVPDVFVMDWQMGSTELVSRTPKGRSGNDASDNPAISGDGRFIAFQSEASDLVCTVRCAKAMEDINLLWDVFLYDRQTRSMTRISGDERGPWMEPSVAPALDATARVVAFSSRHPMSGTDRRNDFDLFIVTR